MQWRCRVRRALELREHVQPRPELREQLQVATFGRPFPTRSGVYLHGQPLHDAVSVAFLRFYLGVRTAAPLRPAATGPLGKAAGAREAAASSSAGAYVVGAV
jgi:hypothetical protein